MTSKTAKNYVAIAKRYAEGVVSGKVAACQWVVKACRRQIADRARKDWEYKFSPKKANEVCLFIEKLPHIKGQWAKNRERISLQPWQIFILTTVFGWINRETDARRFRISYIEVPRKNGKSTFSSGVALYCLVMDQEAGAEVYSAATTRDQAKIVWEDAHRMVERSPGLQTTFGVGLMAHSITQTSTSSRFQALSAEGNTLDGLNIHCAIVDELHAHSTRKVYDVLETASGSRTQPLLWLITTAGSDRSGICYEQRGYVTKILENVTKDETYFGIIYTLDEDDDWQDPVVWRKANPNYGISVFPDDIARLAEKAKKMASAQSNFLTKRLSVWVNADAPLFNMVNWDACRNSELKEDDFLDDECWAAVDLAPRHDFVAYGKLFRRNGEYYFFCRHYLSEGEIEESSNSSFDGWAREGWISTNEGNVTKYDDLELELEADYKRFQIREVCFDPFSAHQFATRMLDKGFPMIEIRSIVQNFSEATKKLDALMSEHKIHHIGDPVLTWEISNVVGHYDRKDNVFPVKERPELKIDGAVCLVMALNRAILDEGSGSIYDLKPGQTMEEVWA